MAQKIADQPHEGPLRIALLGCTGSIGTQTLEVIEAQPGRFSIVGLAARGGRIAVLNEQIRRFSPLVVAIEDEAERESVDFPADRIHTGADGLQAIATLPEADLVVIATSGHAAIRPTLAAIAAGKEIALANKETIVCAGELVIAVAQAHGITIRPIDSEHSALWQSLQGSPGIKAVRSLIITGSGGPFRTLSAAEIEDVTPQRALQHPTWPTMGGKITIDSATLMNKGLEVIEARWLFDLLFEQIDVLIHPQSTVHSLVEYIDGAIVAQLGMTDMRGPIAYALTYPERLALPFPRLNLAQAGQLTFEEPDHERFPCLKLAYQAGRAGGLMPTVLSAADEEAVAAFLRGDLGFVGIPQTIETALAAYDGPNTVSLEGIEEADRWARDHVRKTIASRVKER